MPHHHIGSGLISTAYFGSLEGWIHASIYNYMFITYHHNWTYDMGSRNFPWKFAASNAFGRSTHHAFILCMFPIFFHDGWNLRRLMCSQHPCLQKTLHICPQIHHFLHPLNIYFQKKQLVVGYYACYINIDFSWNTYIHARNYYLLFCQTLPNYFPSKTDLLKVHNIVTYGPDFFFPSPPCVFICVEKNPILPK